MLFTALEVREVLTAEHRLLTGLHQAILHASLDCGSLSIDKFSRWLRAICTMLLSRNTAEDRTKAIGYVEQAVRVLEDHTQDGAQVPLTLTGLYSHVI